MKMTRRQFFGGVKKTTIAVPAASFIGIKLLGLLPASIVSLLLLAGWHETRPKQKDAT